MTDLKKFHLGKNLILSRIKITKIVTVWTINKQILLYIKKNNNLRFFSVDFFIDYEQQRNLTKNFFP